MTPDKEKIFKEWLATRPESIRKLALKYPPNTRFLIHGTIHHVIGYREDGAVRVTDIDPNIDYDSALATGQYVCQCCVDKLDDLMM